MTWSANSNSRSVPHKLQQDCFRRDHWTCQRCGYIGRQHKGDLHADHITPRSQDGADELGNLETRCVPCHKPKSQGEARAGRGSRYRTPEQHPALRRSSKPR